MRNDIARYMHKCLLDPSTTQPSNHDLCRKIRSGYLPTRAGVVLIAAYIFGRSRLGRQPWWQTWAAMPENKRFMATLPKRPTVPLPPVPDKRRAQVRLYSALLSYNGMLTGSDSTPSPRDRLVHDGIRPGLRVLISEALLSSLSRSFPRAPTRQDRASLR